MFFHQVDQDLSLRLLSGLDAKDLFELTDNSRAYLREWLPWLDITLTVDDSDQFIENAMTLFNNQQALIVGIFYKEKMVGMAGFNEFDWKNRIGNIGYWLGIDYQGRGIITRTVYALVNYGFNELNLNRIDLRMAEGNIKSRAIPERLGFTFEGYLRQTEWLYDHYINHAVYSMLAEEWNSIKTQLPYSKK